MIPKQVRPIIDGIAVAYLCGVGLGDGSSRGVSTSSVMMVVLREIYLRVVQYQVCIIVLKRTTRTANLRRLLQRKQEVKDLGMSEIICAKIDLSSAPLRALYPFWHAPL